MSNIYIFHGEHVQASRNAFNQLTDAWREEGYVIRSAPPEGLTLTDAEVLLGLSGLFAEKEAVVFESVLSGPDSPLKQRVLELVSQCVFPVVFWESKKLGVTVLKSLPTGIDSREFTINKKIWGWLDSIRAGNGIRCAELFREAARQDGVEFCFMMFIAHVRKMLMIKDGCPPKQSPFAAKKLTTQTDSFSWEKLLTLQAWCLKTDVGLKSSSIALSLEDELDLLLLSL